MSRYTRDGRPIFAEGSDAVVTGLALGTLIGIGLFIALSLVLSYALADHSGRTVYSGVPVAICDPDVVLYSLFVVGLAMLVLGSLAIIFFAIKGNMEAAKLAWGVKLSSLPMIGLAITFIYGIYGFIPLLPVCR